MAVTPADSTKGTAPTYRPEEEPTPQGGANVAVAEPQNEPTAPASPTAFAERTGISQDMVKAHFLRPPQDAAGAGGETPIEEIDMTTPLNFGKDYGFAEEATTGAEAARRLQDSDTYDVLPGGRDHAADDYAATIERHKDDPQFLEEFFEALGPEKTAEMTARASKQGTAHSIVDGREIDAKSAVADGLTKAGATLSSDFDRRFAAAATADPGTALAVSDVLARGGGNARWLQDQFVQQTLTAERALNTNGDDQYNAYLYARAASGVMAANPQLAHEYLGVDGTLTDAERGAFINNNVAFGPLRNGSAVNDGFERVINGLSNEDFQNLLEKNPNEVRTMVDQFSNRRFYGGQPALANLINKAANLTGSDGAPTAEALGLFDYAMDRVGINDEAKTAAQSFFNRHSSAVMDHLRRQPGGADGAFLSGDQVGRLTDLGVFPELGGYADDGQQIADWLGGQSSDVQAEFMHHMMGEWNGQTILNRLTGNLSDSQRQAFADGIKAAYARDPAATSAQIGQVGDFDLMGGDNFARIIGQTSNADIINSFVDHKLDLAARISPDSAARYSATSNIATALGGLTDAELQQFVADRAGGDQIDLLLRDLGRGGEIYDGLSQKVSGHLVDTLTADGLTEAELERVRSVFADAPRAVTADSVAKLMNAAMASGNRFTPEEMDDLGDITSYYLRAKNPADAQQAQQALTDLVTAMDRNLSPNMSPEQTGWMTGTLAAGLAKLLDNVADEGKRNQWLSALAGASLDGLSAGLGAAPHPAAKVAAVALAAISPFAQEALDSKSDASGGAFVNKWLGDVQTRWQHDYADYGWTRDDAFVASTASGTAMRNNGYS